jgi:hypothetical protein
MKKERGNDERRIGLEEYLRNWISHEPMMRYNVDELVEISGLSDKEVREILRGDHRFDTTKIPNIPTAYYLSPFGESLVETKGVDPRQEVKEKMLEYNPPDNNPLADFESRLRWGRWEGRKGKRQALDKIEGDTGWIGSHPADEV